MVTMFFVVNTKSFKIYTSHFSLLTPPYHTHNVLTSHDNKTIHIVLSTILCVTTHSTPHYPRSSFTTHVLFLLTTFLYPSHSTYPHSHLITSELTPSPLFCFHGVAQSPPQLHLTLFHGMLLMLLQMMLTPYLNHLTLMSSLIYLPITLYDPPPTFSLLLNLSLSPPLLIILQLSKPPPPHLNPTPFFCFNLLVLQ